MPRTRTTTTTLYQFSELSDRAKERARDWWRNLEASSGDNTFAESVIEMLATAAQMIGFELTTRQVQLMNKTTRREPAIYWSLGYCQSDGLALTGRYRYQAGAVKAIIKEFPQETELHAIARNLQAIQRSHFYKAITDVSDRSRSFYMSTETECDCRRCTDGYNRTLDGWKLRDQRLRELDEAIASELRDLAHWGYNALRKEHEYQNSDAVIDETIEANEYEFTEEGERA